MIKLLCNIGGFMDIQIIIRWAFGMFVAGILIIGGIILLFAKIKINYTIGYISKLSVKNEYNWKYANKIFALLLLIVGLIVAIETIIINLLKLDIKIFMPVIICSLFLGLVFCAWLPNFCLKKCLSKNTKNEEENEI